MSKFETLCNEYRENKRLIEELEAMNESLKTEMWMRDGYNVVVSNTFTQEWEKVK